MSKKNKKGKSSSDSSDKTLKGAKAGGGKMCGVNKFFCCCLLFGIPLAIILILLIVIIVLVGGDEVCPDPQCVKVTEVPTGAIECTHNCDCPGAMTCNLFEVCEGSLTSSTCLDYGVGTCDPNADRKTKCTQGQPEDGPKGKHSCADDCGCAGGRTCSAFGWCTFPVAGNTCDI